MKVKIFKAGRYAGPQSFDPQIETEADNEVVDVNPQTAEYLLDNGNAEIVVETSGGGGDEGSAGQGGTGKRGKGKRGRPPAEDKANAETE